MVNVSIVIICKNHYQALNKLLNSVEYQNSKLKFEVLILAKQNDFVLTNYFDTHFIEGKRIVSGRGNYFLDNVEKSLEGSPSINSTTLISFNDKNYLDVLNDTLKNIGSNYVLVVEDKYILGRNFFEHILQTIGDEKSLIHPEFSVLYNEKTGLKQFGNNSPKGRLFEKNIYENIIYAHRDVFKEVKFTNPFGNEFWQFYCDILGFDFKIKIATNATIFENFINEKESNTNILVRTELFEGNKLLSIQSKDIQNSKKINLEMISKAMISKKSVKQLVRNYINGINSEYIDISDNEEYSQLILEWKEANKVEPLLFPENFLLKNIELVNEEFGNSIGTYAQLESEYYPQTRYLLLIPSIKIGGGIKVVQNYIKVLLTKYNPKEIIVVTTDDVSNDESLLPFGTNIIHLKKLCNSDEGMMNLLLRLIMQKSPYAVHNINAELGFKFFAKYAKYLFNASKLYLTHFVPNISIEGKITGHMLEYLPKFYDYLTAVSTDNRTVVDLIDNLYGMGTEKYAVHYQPIEIRKDILTDRKKSLYKLQQGSDKAAKAKDGSIKILWASRIDYQKNIPLLYEIAKHYANEPKTKDKKKVKFLVTGVVEENSREIFNKLVKLSNVKYLGSFNDIRELPVKECDLFLYTSKSDGIPMILIEIMMLGELPILASSVGAVTEIIGERNGILCKTSGDFINAINKYIENGSIYDSYVQDGLSYIINNHNPNQLITNIKEFKDYY